MTSWLRAAGLAVLIVFFIYAAGAELAYQGWRTITETVLARWKGGR